LCFCHLRCLPHCTNYLLLFGQVRAIIPCRIGNLQEETIAYGLSDGESASWAAPMVSGGHISNLSDPREIFPGKNLEGEFPPRKKFPAISPYNFRTWRPIRDARSARSAGSAESAESAGVGPRLEIYRAELCFWVDGGRSLSMSSVFD
jgi:hypothetical protein